MIELADAVEWLDARPVGETRVRLILTDPPHRDTFDSDSEHLAFVVAWYHAAFKVTPNIIHTCGGDYPSELNHYLAARRRSLRAVVPWVFDGGMRHHFLLFHGHFQWERSGVLSEPKPLLYRTLLKHCGLPSDARVYDPFCGRGQCLEMAQALLFCTAGCDIDPDAVDACRMLGL